jgi:hypothetical protein
MNRTNKKLLLSLNGFACHSTLHSLLLNEVVNRNHVFIRLLRTMMRSIVPRGFEATAHPVFSAFAPPPVSMSPPSGGAVVAAVDPLRDSGVNDLARPAAAEPSVVQACGLNRKTSREFGPDLPSNVTVTEEAEGEFVCAICLEEIQEPVTLVFCLHQYCYQCLYAWYKTRMTCPKCKSNGRVFVYRGPSNSVCAPLRLWTLAVGDGDSHPAPAQACPPAAAGREETAAATAHTTVMDSKPESARHSAEEVRRAMLRHSEALRQQAARSSHSVRVPGDLEGSAHPTKDVSKSLVSNKSAVVPTAVSGSYSGAMQTEHREPKRPRRSPAK